MRWSVPWLWLVWFLLTACSGRVDNTSPQPVVTRPDAEQAGAACSGGGGNTSPQPVATRPDAKQAGANADEAPSPVIRSLVIAHPVYRSDRSAPEATVALLLSALDDPDPSVREDAIEALGDRGDPEGVSGLQRTLYSEHDWLRLSAIDALADIGTNEAVMALGPLLSDDDVELREAIVDALGDIRTDAARGYLEQALSDSDWNVRATAGEALAELFDDFE